MNDAIDNYRDVPDLYGLLGNMMLSPATELSPHLFHRDFWERFPLTVEFPLARENEHFHAGIRKVETFLSTLVELSDHERAIKVSVEFTRLFIGPPSPAAPPWESMNKGESEVGFGQPTYTMRTLLDQAGLTLTRKNAQYEDHLGIELLYLSYLFECFVQERDETALCKAGDFIDAHPLSWIEPFRARIDEAYPDGFFTGFVELIQGVLEGTSEQVRCAEATLTA